MSPGLLCEINSFNHHSIQLSGKLSMRCHLRVVQQKIAIQIKFRTGDSAQRHITCVHADRVLRAGFHAQPAEAAAQQVDFEGDRVFFDSSVRRFSGSDLDTIVRTGGFTHHAGNAARRSIGSCHQAMPPAPARRDMTSLLRIEHRYHRILRLHSNRSSGMPRQISEEMPHRHTKALQELRIIRSLNDRQLGSIDRFNIYHDSNQFLISINIKPVIPIFNSAAGIISRQETRIS